MSVFKLPKQFTPGFSTKEKPTIPVELDYTNTDKRQIAVDTEIVSGMENGQVTAYLCIAKDVSTLQIFVCPDPVIT